MDGKQDIPWKKWKVGMTLNIAGTDFIVSKLYKNRVLMKKVPVKIKQSGLRMDGKNLKDYTYR